MNNMATNMLEEVNLDDTLSDLANKWKTHSDLRIHSVIEELGPYLTNKCYNERLKGTYVLSNIILETSSKLINKKEVEHLLLFFCDRLKDHHSIVPYVLKGILNLVSNENFPEEQAVITAKAIFREVHIPSHFHNDRYCVYIILFKLLMKHMKELEAMGSEFVFEYIQVMDGERDPKCLLLALHTLPIIINHFDMGAFVEDLFEVFSCYFPIDFNPPANDKNGITREDLNIALQKCFLSTDKFADHSFPLLLEKLDSDLLTSKIDSLKLISLCCQTYKPASVKSFLLPIITSLCKEALITKYNEIQNKLFNTLTDVLKVASILKKELNEEILNDLLIEIWKECDHLMHDFQSLQLYNAPKILQHAAVTSQECSNWILSKIFPHFLHFFTTSTKINEKQLIIDVLSEFINITKQYADFQNEGNPYQKYQESIIELYYSSLNSSIEQLQLLAIKGLKIILLIKGMIKPKHLSCITDFILTIALSNKPNIIRINCVELLSVFANNYPYEVKEKILPHLFHEISLVTSEVESTRLKILLEFIVAASSHHMTLTEIITKLLSYFKDSYNDNMLQYMANSLLQITNNFIHTPNEIDYLYNVYFQTFRDKIITVHHLKQECFSIAVSDILGRIFQIIVQQLNISTTEFLMLDIQKNLNILLEYCDSTQSSISLQYHVAMILRAVFANYHKDFHISEQHFSTLIAASEKIQDDKVHLLITQSISSILNKMNNEKKLVEWINMIIAKLTTILNDESNPDQNKSAIMWIWITKALLLRGYSEIDYLISQMISWLSHKSVGKIIANGFGTVLEEIPEVLSTECNINAKLLYRQKFFLLTLPYLLSGFENSSEDQRYYYLTAICHQLKFQAKPVLISELPKLLPIISRSLCCDDPLLLISVLNNLVEVLEMSSHLFENHIQTMISKLLNLATSSVSMKVRTLSLRCLKAITVLPHHILLPFRQEVIKKISPCLDDKKRLVRKEAVAARCEWFLIGQSGNENKK